MEHFIVGKVIFVGRYLFHSFIEGQWWTNKLIPFMVNFGFLLNEVVRLFLEQIIFLIDLWIAHKVTEMKKGSEEVNVSYADPENQSCKELFTVKFLEWIRFLFVDVSISGRADLVDDNTKKRDLWSESLKAW